MPWANPILIALATLALLPVAVFCIECLAALLPARRVVRSSPESTATRPSVAVLIPAHNEEELLADTLRSLFPQLQSTDRVIVIADNCTDTTASIARASGATVIERRDDHRLGKGFALDFGLAHLRENPPDIVIMLDADCLVQPGAIDALVSQIVQTRRPAQACYLMERPAHFNPKLCVSTLAFLVKNWVRPRGLLRMGLPCMLTGSGMAFPWAAIAKTRLASPNIVEDMQLGLDLALDNDAPLFCGGAHVTGRLPRQDKIAYGQRTRWEHGHLQTIITQAPRMFRAGLRHRRLQAMALAMDLSVPPLALLVLVLAILAAVSSIAAMFGISWWPARILGAGIGAVVLCLIGAWARFGRGIVPASALLAAPIYIAWKVPMYFAFLFRRETEWVRTAREAGEPPIIPVVDALQLTPADARAHEELHGMSSGIATLDAAGFKRFARVLNRSTPHEQTLLEQLEELDRLSITDPLPQPVIEGRGLLDHVPCGPSLIYQSFLRGFVSEMGGGVHRSEFALGQTMRNVLDQAILREGPLGRLRAVILLGGAVRPSRWSLSLGRSVLDLPLEDGRSILWHWRDHVIQLRELIGLDHLPVRVMVDRTSIQPTAPARGTQVRVGVERDASQYRGTAGVLRDACAQYASDDYILVGTAAQAMRRSLCDLALALAEPRADVTLISHADGSPSGLMLIRCGALQGVAEVGYVDLKEQALPMLAKNHTVRHISHAVPTGLPIRTLAEYVAAVQHRYRQHLGKPLSSNPFAEDCQSSFAVIEDGASVHPSASVHDSVILRGSHVGPNVLVVRSVIGPGIILMGGEQVVDRLISGSPIETPRAMSGYQPTFYAPREPAGFREEPA